MTCYKRKKYLSWQSERPRGECQAQQVKVGRCAHVSVFVFFFNKEARVHVNKLNRKEHNHVGGEQHDENKNILPSRL